MNTISITVQVPAVELTEESIREAVIEKIAAMTLGLQSVRHYDDETGEERTSQQVPALKHMKDATQQTVTRLVKEYVEREIPAVVAEVLAGEYQPTTKWGEKDGGPTTIRAMIGKIATDYYETTVDSEGRAHNQYNRSAGTPRLEWLIRREVEIAYKATIAEQVKVAAEEVKRLMAAKVNEELKAVVNRIIGTK